MKNKDKVFFVVIATIILLFALLSISGCDRTPTREQISLDRCERDLASERYNEKITEQRHNVVPPVEKGDQ